ncbi:MAG: bifunctional 2-polyprenyl-6-hydroxyphenol methylase/3-demethylubiquinol 3-O-methyltransferase UbiG [Proteobacteria bacterium]|nr:bifunctional 2-polyprenyl-6-hydroxyphenol methylase/3-demethylubiquinol 3-O-methyltransferase UbiG [Pseudomonadota bacterium]
MTRTAERPVDNTVDEAETAKFAAMAEEWWDPEGKFAPLHKLNPVRLEFLRDRICAHFGCDPMGNRPLDGLALADVGCGGGLLSEPMARLGATVTGIDAGEKNVRIATAHAETVGVEVDYRCDSVEAMAARGETYDVVLNMEVVEHVADVGLFLEASAALVKPGGMMFLATLNRTLKAFGLAIVGAEYILGWLPRGTHDWNKFVRPSELAAPLRRAGLEMTELAGVAYNPLKDKWSLAPRDLDVNYMAVAERNR